MDLRPGRPLAKHEIAELLSEARARTLLLVQSATPEDLVGQPSPLMSPIVWDLGHIAHFEEVWLVENLNGGAIESEGLRGVYNPFENPRSVRRELDLPKPREAVEYLATVRRDVMRTLAHTDLEGPDALVRDGFVYRMVLQHEYQHNETILQALQLMEDAPYRAPRTRALPKGALTEDLEPGAMVRFPGGLVRMGTDDESEAYDNERPAHEIELAPFWIDATPVTCGQFREFIEADGYRRTELWSEEGRAWLTEEGANSPLFWWQESDGWWERVMDRKRPVDPTRPVCHVSYHEAAAFARWAEKRLPTEAEWEAAASWDPVGSLKSRYPWGEEPPTQHHANIDALTFDTAPSGSYPLNRSPIGCTGMIGDVWEWTSSDFVGYPGYRTFPYKEYSEVFFGDEYKVLRGGSWATRGGAVRSTFRNWDYPIRRQIFSGFRCARDAS